MGLALITDLCRRGDSYGESFLEPEATVSENIEDIAIDGPVLEGSAPKVEEKQDGEN